MSEVSLSENNVCELSDIPNEKYPSPCTSRKVLETNRDYSDYDHVIHFQMIGYIHRTSRLNQVK